MVLNKPNDWTIGIRLVGAFAIMLFMTLVMGLLAVFSVNDMAEITERLYNHPLTVAKAIRDIRADILLMHRSIKDIAIFTDEDNWSPQRVDRELAEINAVSSRIEVNLALTRMRFLGDKALIEDVQLQFSEWKVVRDTYLLALQSGGTERRASLNEGLNHQYVDKLLSATQKMIDFAQQTADAFLNDAQNRRASVTVQVASLTVFILLLGAWLSWWITRGITLPLNQVVEGIEAIALGNLGVEVQVSGDNELGRLAKGYRSMQIDLRDKAKVAEHVGAGDYSRQLVPRSEDDRLALSLNAMTTSLRRTTEENERRSWLQKGLNRLAELVRGDQSPDSLAKNIVLFMAKELGAQVGAFYLHDITTGRLQLTGTYAFTRRKQLSEEIAIGQGLVGQAALEGETILVSQVPDDYVRIASGLGEAAPRNLVAVPLLSQGKLQGVLELGSFSEFSDVQLEFLRLGSESMAIALNRAESRRKMAQLLSETQNQAEELQTQQEELRSTNEELEEQTKQLQRSEELLKAQSEELQASNEELEEKTEFLERQKTNIQRQNADLEAIRRDVERKAAELELASRYKSEFLANMSHELRTPLNSLLILANSLEENDEGNLTPDQVESARIIHKSGRDLLALINDILDLSKVEAGKMDVHLEPTPLEGICADLRALFDPLAREKNLQFLIEMAPGLPEKPLLDGQRTTQVLKNLLSNAFKFTPKGSVTLRIDRPASELVLRREEQVLAEALAFSVTDTGIGIPQDKQQAIFEAFQQADGSTARRYGGTGLGLTISREMARLLGGELQLVSRAGEGSTFTLIIPDRVSGNVLPPSAEAKPRMVTPAPRPAPSGTETSTSAPSSWTVEDDREKIGPDDKCLLVVEDDPVFAGTLLGFAAKKGFLRLAAPNGLMGLELAERYQPKAVILDLGLPDIPGEEVLRRLKDNLRTRHIPVHIVSGRELDPVFMQKGAVGYLAKPASKGDLEEMLKGVERRIDREARELLVIEDDPAAQRAIRELIGSNQITITAVASGEEGLALMQQRHFDCIILDMKLPGISGYQVLERLHESHEDPPPVIVYTGQELDAKEGRDLSALSDTVIIKGVNSPDRLLDEVSLFLHTVTATLPASQRRILQKIHGGNDVLEGRKVLLVDDDVRNTFALSRQLQKQGMQVLMADDGQLALEKLDQEAGIELVLMDIMMPVMDGYEAIRRIRSNPGFKNLPVIALTAKAMQEDRRKCLDAGANDYLTKPVEMDKLLSMLRVFLSRR